MSIRAVKRVQRARPHLEGAGVKLQRAFGFGNTTEFDPFLLFDDFRNEQPGRLSRRLSVASAPRHRDDHLRAGGQRRARRQPRQPRQPRRRRRAVDDGGQRHHAPGNAEGRPAGPDARLPALGEPAGVAEDDRAALSGRAGAGHPRGGGRRRHARAGGCAATSGGNEGRSKASRPIRATSTSRCRRASAKRLAVETLAPRVRVRVRGLGHVPRRVAAAGGPDRARRTADATPCRRDETGNRSLVLFDSGDEIVVQAGDEGIRFLLVSGKPIEEPVAWYGPIVMNTQEQLQQAVAELRNGTSSSNAERQSDHLRPTTLFVMAASRLAGALRRRRTSSGGPPKPPPKGYGGPPRKT